MKKSQFFLKTTIFAFQNALILEKVQKVAKRQFEREKIENFVNKSGLFHDFFGYPPPSPKLGYLLPPFLQEEQFYPPPRRQNDPP